MGFINNLFGTIAESAGIGFSDTNFIPSDAKGGIIDLKHDADAAWLGLKSKVMQRYAYEYCAPLATVIDRLTEADVNGVPEIYKKGTDTISQSEFSIRLRKLFAVPNPMQTYSQFRAQQTAYKKVFGWCPVVAIKAPKIDGSFATALWNLPPWAVSIVGTGKMLYQRDITEIVKEYRVNLLGESLIVPASDMILLQDGNFQDEQNGYITPLSKLVGLDFAISNFCVATEADNVLLSKKGPMGFITHDASAVKDAISGYLPMTPNEKNEVQKDLQQYGLTVRQWQHLITRQALKWVPMGFDSKQLGTKETIIQAERTICQRFNYSYILFSDSDSTYANQEGAHKTLYQNNVIPNNEADMREYARFFGCEDNKVEIKCEFSHLPVLQEDEFKKQEAQFKQSQSLDIDYKNGTITINEYRTAKGLEPITNGDTYYVAPQTQQNDVTANADNSNTNNEPTSQTNS